MYLVLLLCQSHVNLSTVSIQEQGASVAIIHSAAQPSITFSALVLYSTTFLHRKVFFFFKQGHIKR